MIGKKAQLVLRVFLFILTFAPIIVFIVLLGVSFKVVNYGYYGLRYNSVASRIMDNGKVYTSGRYFVGPGSKFILFPSKDQFVGVDDIHIVNNMSSYEIGVSAIYSIPKDNILSIYSDYENFESFEKSMVRVLNHTFSTQASVLDYADYFENQGSTQESLENFLKKEWGDMGVDIRSFFIDYVTYTKSIEYKLTKKQIAGLNNTYQEEYKSYNQVLNKMSKMKKDNELRIDKLYADTTAHTEYNKVIGQLNVTEAQSNMMACVLSMYTEKDTLKDVVNNSGSTEGEDTGNTGSGSESGSSSTETEDKGIGFEDTEFMDFMKNRAILSAKAVEGDTNVLELTNYVDL